MPRCLQNISFKDNTSIHVHATRTPHTIHLLTPNHEYANKRIRYDIPNVVNNTPDNIIEKIYTQPARFLWISKETPATNIPGELHYYKLLYMF